MAAILHELFVQTDTGVAVVDRGHCILAWNPGAERLFGWPAPEITGQDIVKLLAPEGSPVRRYLGAALRGDVVQAVPVMLRQKSGDLSQLLLTCRGVVTSQDEPPSVVLFFDPTPRRQTVESTLAHRTRELQRIIGAFPDLFFWADSSGRVLDYHAGSEVDLTLPQEQFLGHRVSESFEGEAGPRLQEAIEICLREHRTVATEYTLPAPSRPRHFEARIVPLTPDDVVAVVRDMTTQRRLEEELKGLKAGLGDEPGSDRAPAGRELVDRRDVEIGEIRHGKRARNRRRAHHELVRGRAGRFGLAPQRQALLPSPASWARR